MGWCHPTLRVILITLINGIEIILQTCPETHFHGNPTSHQVVTPARFFPKLSFLG